MWHAFDAFETDIYSLGFFGCNSPIRDEYEKVEFRVCGLEVMKGSAEKAKVLYAKIQSESLQRIADEITQSFIDAGKEKYSMNTK